MSVVLHSFRPPRLEQSSPAQGSPEICHCHQHQGRHLWHEDAQKSERCLLQEEEAEEAPSPGGRDLWYRERGGLTWMLLVCLLGFTHCGMCDFQIIYQCLTKHFVCFLTCRSTSWQSRGRRTRRLSMLSSCPSSRKYLSWKDTCALPSVCQMVSTHTSWFSKCVVIKVPSYTIYCLLLFWRLVHTAWMFSSHLSVACCQFSNMLQFPEPQQCISLFEWHQFTIGSF